MHPVYPPVPPHPHPQDNVQRSWSDEHIRVNNYPRDPLRAPRSFSFSASRAPQPQWTNHPPPPPVPPLPPALQPGFSSPPLAHANIDFTFAEPPRYPVPQPWPGPSNVPSSSYNFTPPLPRPVTDSAPSWHPFNQHNHFPPNSSVRPSRPVVPPRPATDYFPNGLGNRHPSSYTLAQDYINLDHSPSPPPAVPSRPTTAHGDRSAPSAPPVPPKTFTSPVTPPLPFPGREHDPTPSGQDTKVSPFSDAKPIPEFPVTSSPPSEPQALDSDLKRALTLSLAESQRKHSAVETLGKKEDDELARALAESLLFSTKLERNAAHTQKHLQTDTSYFPNVTESSVEPDILQNHAHDLSGVSETRSGRRPSVPERIGSDILSPEELEDYAAHGQIIQELEDEEVTRRLQGEEDTRLLAELREREKRDEERARKDAELTKRLQEEETRRLEAEKRERGQRDQERVLLDEELARREEVEERAQRMMREAQERKDAEIARRLAETNSAGRSHPPQGAHPAQDPALVSRPPPAPPQYNEVVTPSGGFIQTTQSPPHPYNGPPQQTLPGRAASSFVGGPARSAEHPGFTRSVSAYASVPGRRSDNGLMPEHVPSQPREPSPGRSNDVGPSAGPSRTSPNAGPSAAPQDNATEPDLLKCVSYGFKPPDLNPATACPPFPEVISLFRAPCPPFHIMATSWRHLMRLLAQLETRIEANLNVIAHTKDEHLLRVVVQFVKLPSGDSWRTILHLTLDQPIPRNMQNSWRFTNKDTTTLPYSYTLSEPIPYLVNNTRLQFYVIPLSATSPFPILPITLPNLALYLQSAMRDSRARKVQNDPSNGMRRLAKMVTECYPEEVVNPDKEERKPSRGVGNLLKRVVGRGGEREESGNEDVYDIITPFRIDQYTIS